MKTAKAPKVPVLENAFEVNLPKLMRAAKATQSSRLTLDDGDVRTVVVLAETRLAVFLGGQQWIVDIVPVQCLQGRMRPLLKCPRAHEGNFQALYFRGEELACRHCHALRYRTNVVASKVERARIARIKLMQEIGADPARPDLIRQPHKWRKRHLRLARRIAMLTNLHYEDVHAWIKQQRET